MLNPQSLTSSTKTKRAAAQGIRKGGIYVPDTVGCEVAR
jgi:hypothetical protein